MADVFVNLEILDDANFKRLVAKKVAVAAFTELVEENSRGYSQKKRLHEGLKEFSKKVEDAEQRLFVAKNVGSKAKGAGTIEDKVMVDDFDTAQLREKCSALNANLEAMIEEGAITQLEKPLVVDNLRARLQKAKEGGKAKLEEKLDKMFVAVTKVNGTFELPVANIAEFHRLDTDIQAIEKAEKAKSRGASGDGEAVLKDAGKSVQAVQAARKAKLQAEYAALEDRSRMWFETSAEFKPRVREAVATFAAKEKIRKKKEEDEAFQLRIKEENEAQEIKRAEAARKEELVHKEIEDKLKSRRLEVAARPVKEVAPAPEKKKIILPPKEKVKVADDALGKLAEEEDDLWETLAKQEAERKIAEAQAAKEAQEEADRKAAEEEATQAAEDAAWAAEEAEKEAARQKEVERLSKQKEDSIRKETEAGKKEMETVNLIEKAKLDKMKAEDRAKAEAVAKAKLPPTVSLKNPNGPAPTPIAPKVNRKPAAEVASKWGSAPKSPLLTFDAQDGGDLLEKLAAQEKKEKAERAAAQKAAEEAAARQAAEEEEAVLNASAQEIAEKAAAAQREKERLLKQKVDSLKKVAASVESDRQKAERLQAEAALAAAKASAPPSVSLKHSPAAVAKAVAKAKNRAPPVERASKWGKPVGPAFVGDDVGEDLLEKLAAQEAEEKKERARKAAVATETAAMKLKDGETAWGAGAKEEEVAAEGEDEAAAPVPEVAAVEEVAPQPKASPSLADSLLGPSLADSMKAPKTKTAAQPKTKAKKGWAKVDLAATGFELN